MSWFPVPRRAVPLTCMAGGSLLAARGRGPRTSGGDVTRSGPVPRRPGTGAQALLLPRSRRARAARRPHLPTQASPPRGGVHPVRRATERPRLLSCSVLPSLVPPAALLQIRASAATRRGPQKSSGRHRGGGLHTACLTLVNAQTVSHGCAGLKVIQAQTRFHFAQGGPLVRSDPGPFFY